jgi:cyclin C
MAGNFWQSSHFQQWLLDKQELELERLKDRKSLSNEDIQKLFIFYTNFIQTVGESLKFRQQIIATAIVFFRRFYSRNSFGDVDPVLLGPTCLYLASKVEEYGVPPSMKFTSTVANVIKQRYSQTIGEFKYTSNKICECEFLLLEMLDCCLIVYHAYRPLTQYIADVGQEDILLPTAWRIVNDTYRCDICLIYPPYLIALSAIHMSAVVHKKDIKQWFVELSVDMSKILEITKQLLELYEVMKKFDDNKDIPPILTKIPKPKTTLDKALNASSSTS